MSGNNRMLIAQGEQRFVVKVRDDKGRDYLHIPAVGVACRSPLDDWPLPSDAPLGEGPLFVLLVRAPYTPAEDDPDETQEGEK